MELNEYKDKKREVRKHFVVELANIHINKKSKRGIRKAKGKQLLGLLLNNPVELILRFISEHPLGYNEGYQHEWGLIMLIDLETFTCLHNLYVGDDYTFAVDYENKLVYFNNVATGKSFYRKIIVK